MSSAIINKTIEFQGFHILPDLGRDFRKEKKEIEDLSKSLKDLRMDDMKLMRCIGHGDYGACFLCEIDIEDEDGIRSPGIFVAKFLLTKDEGVDARKVEETRKLIERESLELTFHKNIVPIVHHDPEIVVSEEKRVELRRLFDLRLAREEQDLEDWEDHHFVQNGVMIMKYYPSTLDKYLTDRISGGKRLRNNELCILLFGVLEGAEFLHKNHICHHDIHDRNVFVLATYRYGRVIIGDFGCAINFQDRGYAGPFKVRKSGYKSMLFSSEKIGTGPQDIARSKGCLVEDLVHFYDLSKTDIHMIGKNVAKLLLDSIDRNQEDAEFTKQIEELVQKMVEKDFHRRITILEAIHELQRIMSSWGVKHVPYFQSLEERREDRDFGLFGMEGWAFLNGENKDQYQNIWCRYGNFPPRHFLTVFNVYEGGREMVCFLSPIGGRRGVLNIEGRDVQMYKDFSADCNFDIEVELNFRLMYAHKKGGNGSAGAANCFMRIEFDTDDKAKRSQQQISVHRHVDKWYDCNSFGVNVNGKDTKMPVDDLSKLINVDHYIDEKVDFRITVRRVPIGVMNDIQDLTRVCVYFRKKAGKGIWEMVGDGCIPTSVIRGRKHRILFGGRYWYALRHYMKVGFVKFFTYPKSTENEEEEEEEEEEDEGEDDISLAMRMSMEMVE